MGLNWLTKELTRSSGFSPLDIADYKGLSDLLKAGSRGELSGTKAKIVNRLTQVQSEKELLDALQNLLRDDSFFERLGYKEIKDRRYCLEFYLSPYLATASMRAARAGELLLFYGIIGVIVGARLGDILFYQDIHHYLQAPLDVFKVWNGGLASHGGVVGLLVATLLCWLRLRRWLVEFTLLTLLDLLVPIALLPAALIRLGNFINQEILGYHTAMPWAVIFGSEGSRAQPRHPVQLYEALFYLLFFVVIVAFKKRAAFLSRPGKMTGLFFAVLFTFRVLIEFFKEPLGEVLSAKSFFSMGQLLSLPFIVLGLLLLFIGKETTKNRDLDIIDQNLK